jgi:hypothetical protein
MIIVNIFLGIMETLTPKSKIKPFPRTFAVDVSDTYVSFQSHYETFINPTTAVTGDQRNFVFNLSPSMQSEIYLPETEIHVKFRIIEEGGNAIARTDQPGIIQAFGALWWQNCVVRINGNHYLCMVYDACVCLSACQCVHVS